MTNLKKKLKRDMIHEIIRDMEIIEEAYPELTATIEFQKLNCFRVEGYDSITGNRYTKADLQYLVDRLEAKKMQIIFG